MKVSNVLAIVKLHNATNRTASFDCVTPETLKIVAVKVNFDNPW